mmetsp:Transcript_37105/g.116676  ORF Transcript_37105/g.116676 Transcript_37105/m.116676 type:complete len:399 (-) Transcript_37105:273-1469(-)
MGHQPMRGYVSVAGQLHAIAKEHRCPQPPKAPIIVGMGTLTRACGLMAWARREARIGDEEQQRREQGKVEQVRRVRSAPVGVARRNNAAREAIRQPGGKRHVKLGVGARVVRSAIVHWQIVHRHVGHVHGEEQRACLWEARVCRSRHVEEEADESVGRPEGVLDDEGGLALDDDSVKGKALRDDDRADAEKREQWSAPRARVLGGRSPHDEAAQEEAVGDRLAGEGAVGEGGGEPRGEDAEPLRLLRVEDGAQHVHEGDEAAGRARKRLRLKGRGAVLLVAGGGPGGGGFGGGGGGGEGACESEGEGPGAQDRLSGPPEQCRAGGRRVVAVGVGPRDARCQSQGRGNEQRVLGPEGRGGGGRRRRRPSWTRHASAVAAVSVGQRGLARAERLVGVVRG